MLLDEKCVDLVCITETHFSEEILDAEINLTGFTAFRGDRNFKLDRTRCKADEFSGGGGSVIYVRNNIKVVDKSHCTTLDSTSLVLETDIGKVLIGCFYRSPSLNEEQNSKFLETFSQKAVSDDDIEKVICLVILIALIFLGSLVMLLDLKILLTITLYCNRSLLIMFIMLGYHG